MKIIKGDEIKEVSEKAYRIIYKDRGYEPYEDEDLVEEVRERITGNYDNYKKDELKEELNLRGISYSQSDTKDELIEILKIDDSE